jgi:hypothetical protein
VYVRAQTKDECSTVKMSLSSYRYTLGLEILEFSVPSAFVGLDPPRYHANFHFPPRPRHKHEYLGHSTPPLYRYHTHTHTHTHKHHHPHPHPLLT